MAAVNSGRAVAVDVDGVICNVDGAGVGIYELLVNDERCQQHSLFQLLGIPTATSCGTMQRLSLPIETPTVTPTVTPTAILQRLTKTPAPRCQQHA